MDFKLTDAYQAYADALGRGAAELTRAEKQQAIWNHILHNTPPDIEFADGRFLIELGAHQLEPGAYERVGEALDRLAEDKTT